MTAIAGLLSTADRDRLAARLAELRDLASVMRQPGAMPAVPEPPALHQMAGAHHDRRTTMSRPQFKPIHEHLAELAAYAASHTPEEVRQEIDRLPPGVRRKVLDAASHGAFSWAERHGKQSQGRFELGEDGWGTTTGGQRP